MIGGPGAGKTTSSAGALDEGNIVFDGSAVHAEPLIDEAVSSGRTVNVEYVHRDPVDAFRGTLDRAMNSPTERGRVIPLELHEELHRGIAEAIERIQEKYAGDPNVRIRYTINSSTEPPTPGSIKDIRQTRYTGIGERLRDTLESERTAGRVSQQVYDRVREGPGSGHSRGQDAAGDDEGIGSGAPRTSGSAALKH